MGPLKTETVEQYIVQSSTKVIDELKRIIPDDWELPQPLRDSMLYSLLAGGKRMRPILLLAASEALQGREEAALPAACAIELIHTYSLVHDDLPAMDDDDFRRGKPTNHKMFGEAMAILAGDGLLTHAFYALSVIPDRFPEVQPSAVLKIVQEFSLYAGAKGMVGGQAADILGEQGQTNLQQLEYIHLHKTSDLVVCALRAGGRLAGATEAQLEALTTFGRSIGLAFQIQDDILDVEGDPAKLGKNTNSDLDKHKVTYPYLIGMEESKAKVRELTRLGKESLLSGQFAYPDRLIQLADYLMSRDS